MPSRYTNQLPSLFNIPNQTVDSSRFHKITSNEESEGYKVAKTLRPRLPTPMTVVSSLKSRFTDARNNWAEPTYRTLKSGSIIKITHAFKTDGIRSEHGSMVDFWVSENLPTTPTREPVDASVPGAPKKGKWDSRTMHLKQVNEQSPLRGKTTKRRRDEDAETMAFFASVFRD
jgi:hypothetical protein